MNFFEAQERARRLSGWLVALFGLAVLAIALAVYFVLAVTLLEGPSLWEPGLFLLSMGGVGAVVGLASLARSASLRAGGGAAVAEMLGGRLLTASTSRESERRLLNVVEEIALAAGTSVPAVYVLDNEHAMNAFAAGYSSEDAVVAMTRGALEAFDRDELQAVVAHEFSHIVNRDIRLNIRLIGLLFGILALGLGGRMLLRASFYSSGGRRDGRVVAATMALGLALFVLGYLGVFLGRIIRAGVSRQREYLADAAAVQFTRNPDAMASALKKIGAVGSHLQSPSAEEASHFFFASGLKSGLASNIWSTHPPLIERIRRLDPHFDGDFTKVSFRREGPPELPRDRESRSRPSALEPIFGAAMLASDVPPAAPTEPLLQLRVDDVPATLRQAARDPFAAVALAYALILDRDEGARRPQLELLDAMVVPQLREEVQRLLPAIDALPSDLRIALVDLAAPALRLLSDAQTAKLLHVLKALAAADRRLSVFEFALKTAVRHRLAATHGRAGRARRLNIGQLEREVSLVVGALALAGATAPEASRAAYRTGMGVAGLDGGDGPPACTSDDVGAALDRLADAPVAVRERLLQACAATALDDRVVVPEERYLLRALGAALDVRPRIQSTDMPAPEPA